MGPESRGVALLRSVGRRLQAAGIPDAAREARDLIQQALAGPGVRPQVPHHARDWDLDEGARAWLENAVARRERGEPFAYIAGWAPFFGLDLRITPSVLAPRPETEELAERVCEALRGGEPPAWVLDLGCGSGCLGLAVAAAFPQASLWGLDLSAEALRVAVGNRGQVPGRVGFVRAELLSSLRKWPAGRGVLLANLPYVEPDDVHNGRLAPEVLAHEPAMALFPPGGESVTGLFQRLFSGIARLGGTPAGGAWLEIGAGQGGMLSALAERALPRSRIEVLADRAGRERFLTIRNGHPGRHRNGADRPTNP